MTVTRNTSRSLRTVTKDKQHQTWQWGITKEDGKKLTVQKSPVWNPTDDKGTKLESTGKETLDQEVTDDDEEVATDGDENSGDTGEEGACTEHSENSDDQGSTGECVGEKHTDVSVRIFIKEHSITFKLFRGYSRRTMYIV